VLIALGSGIVGSRSATDSTEMLEFRHLRREDGQTMAEYGGVLAVITLMAVAALGLLSTHVGNTLVRVGTLVGFGNG
jgi:Flp pilus assembly pilin Flp